MVKGHSSRSQQERTDQCDFKCVRAFYIGSEPATTQNKIAQSNLGTGHAAYVLLCYPIPLKKPPYHKRSGLPSNTLNPPYQMHLDQVIHFPEFMVVKRTDDRPTNRMHTVTRNATGKNRSLTVYVQHVQFMKTYLQLNVALDDEFSPIVQSGSLSLAVMMTDAVINDNSEQ